MSNLQGVVFGGQPNFEDDDQAKKDAVVPQSIVHIRSQQRNGRKSLTLISGLAEDLDLKKILKVLRKMFSTNGAILKDDEVGEVIQLQGDRRTDCYNFLVKHNICTKEEIKMHGF